MAILEEIRQIRPIRDVTLTIGNFDGVHLGHQYLLRELVARARARGRASVALTFWPHPRSVLTPTAELSYLQPLGERLRQMRAARVDHVAIVHFTRDVAAMKPTDFCAQLVEHLRLRELVLGEGATLGQGRTGDIPALREIGHQLGFTVTPLPPLVVDGKVVSSTAIRSALATGDIALANRLLGRPFRLTGPVVHGEARGRKIGFPTANLQLPPRQALPADGVYAVLADFDGERHAGVMNIGIRPSFGGGGRTIEVFLLDWSGDLYGRELQVDVIARLRPELRFSGIDQLVAQIHRDVEQARTLLVMSNE